MSTKEINLESQISKQDQRTSGNIFSVRNIVIGLTGIVFVAGCGLTYAYTDQIFGSKKNSASDVKFSIAPVSDSKPAPDSNAANLAPGSGTTKPDTAASGHKNKSNGDRDGSSNDDNNNDLKEDLNFKQELLKRAEKGGNVVALELLLRASRSGYPKSVEFLLEKAPFNIQAAGHSGDTALLLASANGHFKTVKLLLEKGAYIQAADSDGCTALILASENGHFKTVELLLENNADITAADKFGYTALICSSAKGHLEIVEHLLKNNADITAADKTGCTALFYASKNGDVKIVELLKNAKKKI